MADEVRHLLAELRRCGGTAILTADSVKFRAPAGAVPLDLARALTQRRAELCVLVIEEELAARGLLRCSECRRIMPGHCLAAGVCDDCRRLPATGSLFEESER